MCNWGWLAGPVGGILVGNEQKKRIEQKKQANLLANQELQRKLAEKESENQEKINNINEAVNTDPIKSSESLTNSSTSLKPKRTISTLSLPFKNSGLNVR